jgi:hypothetical protein
VTGIVADLGILSGEIRVESTRAKATSLSDWLGRKAHGLWTTANDVVRTISKSYDAISMATHTALSGFGVIPGFGIVPDLADLALTAAEIPFGKSDGKDLWLASLGVVTTVAPGPVDGVAAGAKIGTRMAKAGAKVADAGRPFVGETAAAGKLIAPAARSAGNLAGPLKFADHHIFPQQFRDFFSSRGIDIHQFTITVEAQLTHLKGIHGNGNLGQFPGRWNSLWKSFIDKNPNASQKEIFQFAGKMLDEFKLGHLPIHPY